jgi:nuclear pore complex protein Nup133
VDQAFALAEAYQDFAGLAVLCNRDIVYPPERNPNLTRIHNYMDKFREDFTNELYQWYIQHGELRVMFANDESHDKYLDQFFRKNSNTSVSWINDLGKARYDAVADGLLHESKRANNLEAKHVCSFFG